MIHLRHHHLLIHRPQCHYHRNNQDDNLTCTLIILSFDPSSSSSSFDPSSSSSSVDPSSSSSSSTQKSRQHSYLLIDNSVFWSIFVIIIIEIIKTIICRETHLQECPLTAMFIVLCFPPHKQDFYGAITLIESKAARMAAEVEVKQQY